MEILKLALIWWILIMKWPFWSRTWYAFGVYKFVAVSYLIGSYPVLIVIT